MWGTIHVQPALCTGCRMCEVACALSREGTLSPDRARVRVFPFECGFIEFPVLCQRCGDYPCVKACPSRVHALSVEEPSGVVKVDSTKCLGERCGRINCAKACRLGSAIFFHPESSKAMLCNLCDGDPACVKVCPSGAIRYIPGSIFDGRHYGNVPAETIAKTLKLSIYGCKDPK